MAEVEARFDADRGLLRLSPRIVGALAPLVAGERGVAALSDDVTAALRAAGLVDDDDRPHAVLGPVAETVAETFVEITAELTIPDGRATARVWVGGGAAVVAAPVADDPEGPLQVAVLHPSGVTWQLSRLLDVEHRPRPAATGYADLPRVVVDGILDVPAEVGEQRAREVGRRWDASPAWQAALEGLARGLRARWTVAATVFVSEQRTAVRQHHVLDGGEAGWYRYDVRTHNDAEVVRLTPCTGRDVLAVLESLLPASEDLVTLADAAAADDADEAEVAGGRPPP